MSQEELDFEWEVRREDIPFQVHMIAGMFAGLFEHAFMLPFDNIKTHSQISSNVGLSDIVRQIYNQEGKGALNFYRGLSVVASGCMPAHAAQFSIYELARNKFGINDDEHHPYLFGLTGALATLFHDIIMTPLDVLKQRRQVSGSSLTSIITSMIKNEGLIALVRSFPITYMMNAPTMAVLVAANESLKTFTQKPLAREHNFISYFLCAGTAGALAATLTNPLDVIKTKIQTQDIQYNKTGFADNSKQNSVNSSKTINNLNVTKYSHVSEGRISPLKLKLEYTNVKYKNIMSTIAIIMKEQGLKGFFRGAQARVLMFAPSSAISWSGYEWAKKQLLKHNYQH